MSLLANIFVILVIFFNFSAYSKKAVINKKDLQAARYIGTVEKQLRKNNLSNLLLKKTKRHLKKSKNFKHYIDEIDLLLSIKRKSLKNKVFSCNTKFTYRNNIEKKFQSYLRRYCFLTFTKLIKDKNTKKLLTNKESLHEVLGFFLQKSNRRFFKVLNKLDKKKKLYNYISDDLLKITLEEGLSISNDFYEHIDINSSFTSLLQSKIHTRKRNKLVFTRELVSMYNKIRKLIKEEQYKKAYQIAEHILAFNFENKRYIYNKTSWKKLLRIGKMIEKTGNKPLARKLYYHTISVSYNFTTYNQSLFSYIWSYIDAGDYKSSIKEIDKLGLIKEFPTLSSQVKFWIAYSLYKEDERSISDHLFKLIINNNPLSYYSIISQEFIPDYKMKNFKKHFLSFDDNVSKMAFEDLTPVFKSNIEEMHVWRKLEYGSKIDAILESFLTASPKDILANKEILDDYDDKELIIITHRYFLDLFHQNEDFLSKFKFISKAMDKNLVSARTLNIRNLFPDLYVEQVKKVDKNINPYLILSIIRQESAFNSRAKSHVGARGLMQLMPTTASSLIKFKKESDLFKPSTNINAGVKYFKKLLKKFDGNLIYALSSYNAGPTRVKKWLGGTFKSKDPIKTIEEIPYKETRLYVKLIYRNFFFYNLLKDKYLLKKKIKDTFIISKYTP